MKDFLPFTNRIMAGVILISLSLVLMSCQYSLALRVLPGSSVQSLTLGISERRDSQEKVQIQELYIYPCSTIQNRGSKGYYPPRNQATWAAVSYTTDPKPVTNKIVYGQSPSGLQVVQTPQPLNLLSCYVVLVYATDTHGNTRSATTGFHIDTAGNVMEMSENEYRKIFTEAG